MDGIKPHCGDRRDAPPLFAFMIKIHGSRPPMRCEICTTKAAPAPGMPNARVLLLCRSQHFCPPYSFAQPLHMKRRRAGDKDIWSYDLDSSILDSISLLEVGEKPKPSDTDSPSIMRIETQLQIAPSLGDLGSGGSGKTLGGGRLGLGALLGDTCARRCCF